MKLKRLAVCFVLGLALSIRLAVAEEDRPLQGATLSAPATLGTALPGEDSATVKITVAAPVPDGEMTFDVGAAGFTFYWPADAAIIKQKLNPITNGWDNAPTGSVVTLTPLNTPAFGTAIKPGPNGVGSQEADLKANFPEAGHYQIIIPVTAKWWAGTGAYFVDPNLTKTITFDVLKTQLNFTGVPRACAGGLENDAHIFTLPFNAQKINGTAAQNLANAAIDFSFENNTGTSPNKKAKFRKADNTWAETATLATDANGNATLTVLSSDTVSANINIVAKYKNASISTVKLNDAIVAGGKIACSFGAVESKRLYGVKTWNETYAQDSGWAFAPEVFERAGQVMTCKLYLRFRRDTDEAHVDKKYFVLTVGNTPIDSLDTGDGAANAPDGIISEGEWNAANARGDEAHPLMNSNETPVKLLWIPVSDHLVRITIEGVSIPGDSSTVSPLTLPPITGAPRVIVFSDAQGNPIRDVTPALGGQEPVPNGDVPPGHLTVKSVNGMVTFYLSSRVLISRATHIEIAADDLSQAP